MCIKLYCILYKWYIIIFYINDWKEKGLIFFDSMNIFVFCEIFVFLMVCMGS